MAKTSDTVDISITFDSLNRMSTQSTGSGSSVTVDAGGLQLNAGTSATGLAAVDSSFATKPTDSDSFSATFNLSNDLNGYADHGDVYLLMCGKSDENNYAGFRLHYGAATVEVFSVLKIAGTLVLNRSEGFVAGAATYRVAYTNTNHKFSFYRGGGTYREVEANGISSTRWFSVENRKSSGTANSANITCGYVICQHTL